MQKILTKSWGLAQKVKPRFNLLYKKERKTLKQKAFLSQNKTEKNSLTSD